MTVEEPESGVALEAIVPEYGSSNWIVRRLFLSRLDTALLLHAWQGGPLLDAGCGAGLLLERLARTVPPAHLHAVDLNPRVAELQRDRGWTVRQADLRSLPFESDFFEAVYCLDVLEHIEDLDDTLQELRRVLAPGGALIVSIPTESFFYKLCRFLLKGTWSMETGPGAGIHYWKADPLLAELRARFDVEEAVHLPIRGPLCLFRVVRLRARRPPAPPPRRVSIVVPAYNEEATIGSLLEQVLAAPIGGLEREVIVVDDGSTDATPDLLDALDAPELRVVRHARNRGKGAALRTGFGHVSGDVVIVQDADLEYRPAEYPVLLRPILEDGAEVVYGSRFRGPDHSHYSYLSYYVGGRLLTWLSNRLFGLALTDQHTGFKVFRTRLLDSLELACDGFEFCPEFTIATARLGIPIVEVPITYEPRSFSEGKKVGWRDGLAALALLFRQRIRGGGRRSRRGA